MPVAATLETFEAELKRLVETFDRNLRAYKSAAYDEASLRQEFLNPFFRALGWDVENTAGLIPQHREVEIESRTTIGGRQKRADYLFRTHPTDRFVCEAKKPAEDLHAGYAFQAKRYAWNKGLALAVLTDFEQMKFFVVGGRPYKDEPDVGLWKTWDFRQYPHVAREIWNLLACERVAAGSIDQLIESLPKKPVARGKARPGWLIKPDRSRALDTNFLNFLDEARRELAGDLLKHNDRADLLLDSRLNEAVQRILDRLLFLRICEDRDIDTGRPLELIVREWRKDAEPDAPRRRRQPPLELREEPPEHHGASGVRAPRGTLWHGLVRHFRALDRRPPSHIPFFNGNLFKPHFSEELVVSDDWLARFLGEIGDEESPYLFNYIPVEILGTIYERFLGKVVRPRGRGVTIEEKPEVRKAGGVYYTPRYIVEYIVGQTVGKLLENRAPEEALSLRILDPACGSGSFLICAFEKVCEYCQQWLTDDLRRASKTPRGSGVNAALPAPQRGPQPASTLNPAPVAKSPSPAWLKKHRDWCWVEDNAVHLTTKARRRILRATIHGVDLDPQAVEVTQLSLYLKMLEGENRVTLARERDLFGSDEALLPALEHNIKCGNSLIASDFSMIPEDLVRVHAFDWPVQFPAIMKAGGFDAIIGNPPWIDIKGLDPLQTDYFFQTYDTVENRMNMYAVFLHREIELLRAGGLVGIITPNSFLTQSSYANLRAKLLESQIVGIVRTPDNVFEGVVAETAISFYAKGKPKDQTSIMVFPATLHLGRIDPAKATHTATIDQSEWAKAPSQIFNLHISPVNKALLAKVEQAGSPLLDLCEFCLGLTPYDRHKGHTKAQIEGRVFHSATRKTKSWKPLLEGGDIHRFFVRFSGLEYIHYGPWLGAPREERFFTQPRILIRQIISGVPPRIYAGYTEDELYNTQVAFNLLLRPGQRESLKYLLAILNSSLLTWFHREKFLDRNKTTFQKILIQDAKTFPIRTIDFTKPADRARHDQLVGLADKMLALVPKLRAATSAAERATLQNAVTATDQQIDALVYDLYGLTAEEIKLVEGAA